MTHHLTAHLVAIVHRCHNSALLLNTCSDYLADCCGSACVQTIITCGRLLALAVRGSLPRFILPYASDMCTCPCFHIVNC
jgi:hypothetical protein